MMNRYFVIGVTIAFLGSTLASIIKPTKLEDHAVSPYIFEDIINSTIESFRTLLPDPLVIDDLNITLPEDVADLLEGTLDLSDLELAGISAFQIPSLSLGLLELQLNFTFVLPSLNVNTEYDGDLVVLNLVPLYGNGKANFHIEDAEIQGSAQVDLSNGISIKNLRIQFSVGDAVFDIHGALDNEDFSSILSTVFNDVFASFVNNHQDVITNILSPILEVILNSILGSINTSTTAAPAV